MFARKQQKEKRIPVPKYIKILVWNTYIGEDIAKSKCMCCNVTNITILNFVCGHVISVATGGKDSVSNLRPICNMCNSSMYTQNMRDFMIKHELNLTSLLISETRDASSELNLTSSTITETHAKRVYCIEETVSMEQIVELLKSDILSSIPYVSDKLQSADERRLNDFCFLMDHFEHRGSIKRYYSPSTADEVGNMRLYADGSLQNVSNYLSEYLCHENFYHINIENCEPMVVLELMKKHYFKHTKLSNYCANRKEWLSSQGQDFKHLLIAQINDTKLYRHQNPEVQELFTEIFEFTSQQDQPFAHVYFREERIILDKIMTIADSCTGIVINALIHDGMIIKKCDQSQLDLFITTINSKIAPHRVVCKPFEIIERPKIINTRKFDYSDKTVFGDLLSLSGQVFESVDEFYMNSVNLLLKTVRLVNGLLITKNHRSAINDHFNIHKKFSVNDFSVHCNGKRLSLSTLISKFASLITFSNYNLLQSTDIDEFSLDCGFMCEDKPLPIDWETRTHLFKKHIFEVNACEDARIAAGFYIWYANMLQTNTKSEMIMITNGKEGIGKGLIPSAIITHILGGKGLICATFRDITENFNSQLAGKRFVLINEMSNKSSTQKHEDNDVLKNMVDASYFLLERKGIDKVKVENCLEFMGCSNYDYCISQAQGMKRRNFINTGSNKYDNNAQYFVDFAEYINDSANIRSIFEFLMTYDITGLRTILKALPVTYAKASGIWNAISPPLKSCLIALVLETEEQCCVSLPNLYKIYQKYKLGADEKMSTIAFNRILQGLKLPLKKPQNVWHYTIDAKLLGCDETVISIARDFIEVYNQFNVSGCLISPAPV